MDQAKQETSARMRRFWDERARENAAWYVDTSLSYDQPDMEQFFATGTRIVEEALLRAPVKPERTEIAVDLGCGLGRITAALAVHFDHVIGVDVSAEMLAKARAHVSDERVEFMEGDGVGLQPIADASVDFVTSFTVLQHLPEPDLVLGYLREGARVLRPGGVLAVQWNNLPHPTMWRAKGMWWRMRQRLGLGMKDEQRNAREFIGSRVPWGPIDSTLRGEGLEVVGRKGERTLFSWVWAVKPERA
ncbi:MAG: class I SAM-dependent methyltransferase [Acidimicrobiales bacterium]